MNEDHTDYTSLPFKSGNYIKDKLNACDPNLNITLNFPNPKNKIGFKYNWSQLIQILQNNNIIGKGEFVADDILSDLTHKIPLIIGRIDQRYDKNSELKKAPKRLSKERFSFLYDTDGRKVDINDIPLREQEVAVKIQEKVEKLPFKMEFTLIYDPKVKSIPKPTPKIIKRQESRRVIEPLSKGQMEFLSPSVTPVPLTTPDTYKNMLEKEEHRVLLSKFQNMLLNKVNEDIPKDVVPEKKQNTITEEQKKLFGWGTRRRKTTVSK